jgi:3-hydroxyisobutyrate dehydrogenase
MGDGTTVAVLGTGIMGAPMARNAKRAGLEVRAWNRSREKAEALAGDGVVVCDSAADAVRGAHVVVTMLTDADTVASVMEEAADGLGDGMTWVQMSTVGVEGFERLRELAGRLGLGLLDAPVSGTRQPAEQGQLTVLAAGEDAAREAAEPFLDAVGAKTVWLGHDLGAATRLKVVLNTWVTALTGAAAEVLALAEGLGVHGDKVLSTLEGGPLDTPYLQLKGQAMLAGAYEPPSFPLAHARKDTGLILDAADSAGLDLPIARAVAEGYRRAEDQGHGEVDMAAVFEAVKPSR